MLKVAGVTLQGDPEFSAGSSHAASIDIRNPTQVAQSYILSLMIGGAPQYTWDVSAVAGETKTVEGVVVMPMGVGTYPVTVQAWEKYTEAYLGEVPSDDITIVTALADLELVSAHFDSGGAMSKEPSDTFIVNVQIKNNLEKDWSPSNLRFGFGHAGVDEFAFSPILWGLNWVTGEIDPLSCSTIRGFAAWPLDTWPVIPAGTTKTFQTTYGLCPGATEDIYDGCIWMSPTQYVIMPSILTVGFPVPDINLLAGRLYEASWGPREYGGYAIFGKVDITIKNDGGPLTGQSPDYVDLQVRILRASDRGQCGFVRFSRDIPSGTNVLTLDRTERGWGVSEVTLAPNSLDYIIEVKLVIGGWPGNPYVQAGFPGTVFL